MRAENAFMQIWWIASGTFGKLYLGRWVRGPYYLIGKCQQIKYTRLAVFSWSTEILLACERTNQGSVLYLSPSCYILLFSIISWVLSFEFATHNKLCIIHSREAKYRFVVTHRSESFSLQAPALSSQYPINVHELVIAGPVHFML